MDDTLVAKKRRERKAMLLALYGLVNGCEGLKAAETGSDIGQAPDPARIKALAEHILAVLKMQSRQIQLEELKAAIAEFDDLPDSDWYSAINDLLSDGMIVVGIVRSGLYGAIGAAYNLEITPRGRALTPETTRAK
jgi:hypothetical protein